jgi:APA family basic amino acid/polyamine antiporter
MGFWGASALVFGNVVGAAIFILPASIAPYGWNAVIAWVISLAGGLCLAWVFARLAASHPRAGGAHGFMHMGVGDDAAFLGSWGYLVSIWSANAAITVTAVSYVGRLVPAIATTPGGEAATAMLIIVLFTWGNARALGGEVQMVSSLIKLLPFAAVIGLAAWSLFRNGMSVLAPVHSVPLSLSTTVSAIGITFYAMLGIESATVPSDAVEDAERTVPRATMFGTTLSGVVTILSTCAVALMMPVAVVSVSKAPVADFIAGFWGSWAGMFVAFCGVISCLGCLNGWLLVGAELPAAMCERGSLPPWFGVRNAHGVPIRSLLIGALVTAALTLLASSRVGVAAFNFAALLSTATNLVLYLLCAITAIRFLRDGRLPRSPGLFVAAVGATFFSVWAMYASGWEALGWGAVLIAFGWPLHIVARRLARRDAALLAASSAV